MTMPLMRPKRKNPVLRTRQMNLPPWARGRVALGMTAAAAEGRFELQVCSDCSAVQYPPREACHRCLSPRLACAPPPRPPAKDPFFRGPLRGRLGLGQLEAGPSVIVHLHGEVGDAPAQVQVGARL